MALCWPRAPTFKGSECPCRFFGLRALHTTSGPDRVHHRSTGDVVGHHTPVRPRARLSRTAPRRPGQTRLTRPLPLGSLWGVPPSKNRVVQPNPLNVGCTAHGAEWVSLSPHWTIVGPASPGALDSLTRCVIERVGAHRRRCPAPWSLLGRPLRLLYLRRWSPPVEVGCPSPEPEPHWHTPMLCSHAFVEDGMRVLICF
jgi:hypothetical protein